MKQLIEVIKLVANKYMNDTNLIISDNFLTLEYLICRNGEKDLYKALRIEEFEDKLKIYVYGDKIDLLIDTSEIESIIQILEKQSKTEEHSQEEIKYIKSKYTSGMKLELIRMYDLINAVPPNTKGTIEFVDDIGSIHVQWENGSTKGLIVGTDEFKILEERSNTDGEHIKGADTENQ